MAMTSPLEGLILGQSSCQYIIPREKTSKDHRGSLNETPGSLGSLQWPFVTSG
eukprot:CAMPEP_0197920730 /NCGR_PEP_ID=MMETSP1439-20131203/89483_1 /TAXON_ID=66791 /ORGANISM="Gonyaulax spinifera, Strain CCMP409" /LENGTH=52 /DNA_ID=CAMNT_0043542945 /DNA_START=11 /DNA_END=166 /DNA_ORIENTATION=+